MIRPLNPLDMAALISFAGSAPNEAAPRESLAVLQPATNWAAALFRQWLALGGKRQTLGYLMGGKLVGLTSVRQRSGPSVWEVDGLCVPSNEEQICAELLETAGGSVSSVEGERLFLRLRSASPLLAAARTAGFSRYLCETLYQIPSEYRPSTASSTIPNVRRRLPGDEHGLFRLHCASAPESVCSAEGLTLELWRSGQERFYRDFVYEEGGELQGWLRVSSRSSGGCFDMSVAPGAQQETFRNLLDCGVQLLHGRSRVFCLVAEHQGVLHDLVRGLGYTEAIEYSALVKHLALRETEPSLMPSRA